MVEQEMKRDRFDMNQRGVYKQKQAYSRWAKPLGTRIAYKCNNESTSFTISA